MVNKEYDITMTPLAHMQKDLRLAVELSDMFDDSVLVTAAANEAFKKAKKLGIADYDSSAVILGNDFGDF